MHNPAFFTKVLVRSKYTPGLLQFIYRKRDKIKQDLSDLCNDSTMAH